MLALAGQKKFWNLLKKLNKNQVLRLNSLRTFLKFENMKFKLIFIFLLFLVGNVGNSQTKLLQKFVKWRIDEKTKYHILPRYYVNQENGRKLFILKMIHINKPEFYQKVKHTIDSLRADGYVIFYEGVRDAKNDNELYERKFRRITHHSLMSYNDEANEVDNKKFGIKGYVYQNDVDYGVNKDTDINCDLSIKELVAKYEEKFGKVILTDCDTNTPMGKKYKCSKKDKKGTDYMILTLRDRHLINEIENSKLDKIVVVYGIEHSYAISRKFENSSWKFVHLE